MSRRQDMSREARVRLNRLRRPWSIEQELVLEYGRVIPISTRTK
jgi:hypothetical protein